MTNRQILLRMLLIVAAAETAVMLLLRGLNLPERIDILLDAPLLALLCAPLIYWFVVRAVAARIQGEAETEIARLAQAVDSTPECVGICDLEGKFVYVNAGFLSALGYRREDVLGRSPRFLFVDERDSASYEAIFAAVRRGEAWSGRLPQRRKDGSAAAHHLTVSPVLDSSGRPVGFVGVARDVAGDIARERELDQARDFGLILNRLLSLSLSAEPLDAILSKALDEILSTPLLSVESKGAVFLTGKAPGTLLMRAQRGLGEPVRTMCSRLPFGRCHCGRAAAERRLVYSGRLCDGHENRYDGSAEHGHYCVPILSGRDVLGVICLYLKPGHPEDEKETRFLGSVADVLAGIILHRRTQNLLYALQALPQAIVESGSFEDALPVVLERVCASSDWAFGDAWVPSSDGKRLLNAARFAHAEGLEAFEEATRGASFLAGEGLPGLIWKNRNYALFPDMTEDLVLSRASAAEACRLRAGLGVPVFSGTDIAAVLCFYMGADRRPTEDDALMIFIAVGQLGEAVHRQRLTEQLRHSQKMDAVGRLAGGIAHDFNNLLTVILGFGGFLRRHLRDSPEPLSDAEEILRAAESASGLTRQLLAFSRRQKLVLKPLRLDELAGRMAKMLRRILGEHIELRLDLQPGPPLIEADAGQLEQVLVNLAVNARDAMPQGGVLTLSVRTVRPGDAHCGCPEPADKVFVQLGAADTGTGMSEEVRARLFEPFFTTKEPGRGTGLGLSVVYGIVSQHGGRIRVESAPGKGAAFHLCFPPSARPAEPEGAAAAEPPGGSESLLVVDDDASVRSLVVRALSSRGYQVAAASSPAEALALDLPVDLLVTDVVMPGMNGARLARELKARRPGLRILYISGYADLPDEELQSLTPLLHKPFGPEDLARAVRSALDAG
ncbi:MAG TPA: hypothetical protein DCM05_17940 [Elusimicrobia bacterium]|nr:hypothetical protein [Elusimicrobiota bacterium]